MCEFSRIGYKPNACESDLSASTLERCYSFPSPVDDLDSLGGKVALLSKTLRTWERGRKTISKVRSAYVCVRNRIDEVGRLLQRVFCQRFGLGLFSLGKIKHKINFVGFVGVIAIITTVAADIVVFVTSIVVATNRHHHDDRCIWPAGQAFMAPAEYSHYFSFPLARPSPTSFFVASPPPPPSLSPSHRYFDWSFLRRNASEAGVLSFGCSGVF